MAFQPRKPRHAGQADSAGKPRRSQAGNPPANSRPPRQVSSHWGNVAQWYDQLVGDEGSEFHKHVIFPGLLELLDPSPRQRILDVACGQGVLCRILHHHGCLPVGMDAAKALIQRARERSNPTIDYHVGDAQQLESLGLQEASFDAATCVLAIQNIPRIAPVCAGVARLLAPGGRFVIVMMHPAFRGPKASGWDWHEPTFTQRRWVSHYLSPRKEAIITHPGKGEDSGHTWTFHHPLQDYVASLAQAGLLVDALEEWTSHKMSDSGPRAPAENVSRQEIPMFLAIRAVKPAPARG